MTIGSAVAGGDQRQAKPLRTGTTDGFPTSPRPPAPPPPPPESHFGTPGFAGVFGFTAGCGLPTVFPFNGGIGISGDFGPEVGCRAVAFGEATCGWTIASITSGPGTPLLHRGQRSICNGPLFRHPDLLIALFTTKFKHESVSSPRLLRQTVAIIASTTRSWTSPSVP